MNKENNQLINQKLDHVRIEMGELSFKEVEYITTGCEKDILILDRKTVISFFREGLKREPYKTRQELIRRLAKQTEVILPESLYISPSQNFVVEKYVTGHRVTPQYIKKHMENAQQIGRAIGNFLKQLHMTSEQRLDLVTGFVKDVRNDMLEGIKILKTKLSQSDMKQINDFLNEL